MSVGKPINSSVPSFRFNATAEEIEELYATDEDHDELSIDTPAKGAFWRFSDFVLCYLFVTLF